MEQGELKSRFGEEEVEDLLQEDEGMFLLELSSEGISAEALAASEKLAEEIAAEWDVLVATGEAVSGSAAFAEGEESRTAADLQEEFDAARREERQRRQHLVVKALSLWAERGWTTSSELLDTFPEASEATLSEVAFHLKDVGMTVLDDSPEFGSEPLDQEACGGREWLDDLAEIATIAILHTRYLPRVGWLDRSDPLSGLVASISQRKLLSRFEEVSMGRAIIAALRPVENLIRIHPGLGELIVLAGSNEIDSVEDDGVNPVLQGGAESCLERGDSSLSPAGLWAAARSLGGCTERCISDCGVDFFLFKATVDTALDKAEEVRNSFVNSNLKLVLHLASKYMGKGLDLSDLVQEGTFGLVKAIERWDPDRGFKLSTYATWWIRQCLSRAIADKGRVVRIPVHVFEKLNRVRRLQREFEAAGKEASLPEIAKAAGLEPAAVEQLISRCGSISSIDEDPEYIGSTDVDEGPLAQAEKADREHQILQLLSTFEPREAKIIKMRFGIGHSTDHTLEQVGSVFGLTRERIRQIEEKVLKRMRHPSHLWLFEQLREQTS